MIPLATDLYKAINGFILYKHDMKRHVKANGGFICTSSSKSP